MNNAFLQLDENKQQTILNAAYREFTEKKYEQASTNKIAKDAGIGKGTLFYYFTNKKNLYQYLIEEAFLLAQKEYIEKINLEETDYVDRIRKVTLLKWQVYQRHPYTLRFLANVFMHVEESILPEELKAKRALLEKDWMKVLTYNIDYSKFREDIPKETVAKFIQWTVEGYRQELEAKVKSDNNSSLIDNELEPFYKKFFSYLDTLKYVYYKEEYKKEREG